MKNIYLTLLLTLTSYPLHSSELKLKPFETDGCTMFVEGPNRDPKLWKHCCVEHDLRYWFGGSSSEMDATDLRLKSCVEKVAGDYWATLIYKGVRAGHYSPIKNKYAWSWAWSVKREDKSLNADEASYVISQLRSLNLDEVNIEDFIKINFPNQTTL